MKLDKKYQVEKYRVEKFQARENQFGREMVENIIYLLS